MPKYNDDDDDDDDECFCKIAGQQKMLNFTSKKYVFFTVIIL